MNNDDKKNQYAILMSKLKKATYEEFYYEAIFIEYAILEDRTDSILKHANINYIDKNGYSLRIGSKLNKIRYDKKLQDKYIKKHLSNELICSIELWKEERNKLIHALVKNSYDYDELKNIALQGECLCKKFASKSQLVNKFNDKKHLISNT